MPPEVRSPAGVIPVRRCSSYSIYGGPQTEGDDIYLDPETLVIRMETLPKGYDLADLVFESVALRTCRDVRTWKLRLAKDAEAAKFKKAPKVSRAVAARKKWRLSPFGERVLVPHPEAGKVIGHVSSERIYGLAHETVILVQHEGDWVRMVVMPYLPWKKLEKEAVKHDHRARYAKRRFEARPTAAERLEDWADSIG